MLRFCSYTADYHDKLPEALLIDLLDSDVFATLSRRPAALRERLAATQNELIIIDKVQKLPSLLDEVHKLIEEKCVRFLLTGSSARKLRSGAANLLGGRARQAQMFPLVSSRLH